MLPLLTCRSSPLLLLTPVRTEAAGRDLLRYDRAASVDGRTFSADHELVRVVGLLADVLEKLRAGVPLQIEAACPARGVGTRIIDRNLVPDRLRIDAREPFDRMQLLRMR